MCGSGVGFDPVVGGRQLTFDFYGIYNGELVFYDRQTESVWSLAGGFAMDGPLAGQRLAVIPALQTTWAAWRALHPDTLVLSDETPYKEHYTPHQRATALPAAFRATITRTDDRLPPFEQVLAVEAGGAHRAYPLAAVAAAGGVINETVGGLPIVVFLDSRSRTAAAFKRSLDGRTLEFAAARNGQLVARDTASGSGWRIDGQAVDGPFKGRRLDALKFHTGAWYAWAAYFPDTSIYGR